MHKNLEKIRREKGIAQIFMAEKLSIAVSTYNMYEKEKRKVPGKIAAGIASMLDLDRDVVFTPVTFAVSKNIIYCFKNGCFDKGNICCKSCNIQSCSYMCDEVKNDECMLEKNNEL